MALPRFLYGHPRENLLLQATAVTLEAGTAETGYGVENLYDNVWANPFRATTTFATVMATFDSAVLPQWALLLNSNLDVAMLLEGNDDPDDWSSPNVSLAFGIPVMNARGFFTSPRIILADESPTPTPQENWRIHIVGNSRLVTIGEFWMGPMYALDGYVVPGARRALVGATAFQRTHQRVPLTYELAPGIAGYGGSLIVSDSGIAQVEALIDRCRYRARQFPCVPRSDVNDAWMARLASDDVGVTPRAADTDEFELPIEMDSRGFPWVEPDDEDS